LTPGAAFAVYILCLLMVCPSGGTVDAADSKSASCKGVGVQVPPGAPNFTNQRLNKDQKNPDFIAD
jgi:hypothetical protein